MARDDDEPRIWALRDRGRVAPQTVLARAMRRVPTDAEKKLWWHLHRLSLKGLHFRRQVRLGPYIADFASHRARVVIEVDGGQHEGNAADAVRTKFIERQGYRVLRFWNNDVLRNIEGVLEVIQAAVDVASLGGAAHSSPPPCGEGSGVGVVPHGTAVTQPPDPPPHPSPTRGEGAAAAPTQLKLKPMGASHSRAGGCGEGAPYGSTPTPDPSPQGGGEKNRRHP
jgi:very-short-patch-repair endonuclease